MSCNTVLLMFFALTKMGLTLALAAKYFCIELAWFLAVSCGGVGGKAIKAPRVPEVYEIEKWAGFPNFLILYIDQLR